ncbi:C2H2 type zinc finger protein [Colletotrichum truncatum]|uniref:C2H2 type zinc finger protein n=1 Tax=Colletotrichum truncatum TaxID=5467 RepID=A0ACC3YDB3_COLTU|nr:C2H2 type zinc finger protein [Colletotrichum truncatum]KAF6784817.1 C2H2 type zinc finger protein [Colletotrichum truncatum]
MVQSTSAWHMSQFEDRNATSIGASNPLAIQNTSRPVYQDDAADDGEQHGSGIMEGFDLPTEDSLSHQDELMFFNPHAAMHLDFASGNDWEHPAPPGFCLGPAVPTLQPPGDDSVDMGLVAYMHTAASGWNAPQAYINSNGLAQSDTIPSGSSLGVAANTNAEESFDPSFETALRCPHPSCSSKLLFTRRCDLYKHYRLHFRKYFCRAPGCVMSHESGNKESAMIGFPTIKDRNRHEKSHNPSIPCPACGRLFGRHDNMRDHYQRQHVR